MHEVTILDSYDKSIHNWKLETFFLGAEKIYID